MGVHACRILKSRGKDGLLADLGDGFPIFVKKEDLRLIRLTWLATSVRSGATVNLNDEQYAALVNAGVRRMRLNQE